MTQSSTNQSAWISIVTGANILNTNSHKAELSACIISQGAITVGVEVWDKDKFTSNDYVGSPSITLWSVTPGLYLDPLRRSLTLKSRYVTMKLDLELYCDKDYYGPSCSVNCVPRDDSSGHYTCDNLGNKICLQHWEGPSCKRCERNWFGPRCSANCVPQDNDFQGHYK